MYCSTDAAAWTKLCHRPFLISHLLVTLVCSCLWKEAAVKNNGLFYCGLAGNLGRSCIPPNLLCKPKAVICELSQLGFHFLLLPLMVLQRRLLALPLPSLAIFSNQRLIWHTCGVQLVLDWCSDLITFDLTVEIQQGTTAILMREVIAENPCTNKVVGSEKW